MYTPFKVPPLPSPSAWVASTVWRGPAGRLEAVEDGAAFQRQLEGVGHAGHVMAVAHPPEYVHGPLAPELLAQGLKIPCRTAVALGQFAGEIERRPLGRAEPRPV